MSVHTKTIVGDGHSDGDIHADHGNTTGSVLVGRGGDDILRGGRYDDWLIGGPGDDQMGGGDGADQFRIYGSDVVGPDTDHDKIYDFDPSEGDLLVFAYFETVFFADGADNLDNDVYVSSDGSAAIIDSYEDIAEIVNNSGGDITAAQKGTTDNLLLTLTEGDGSVQIVELSHAWAAYDAAYDALYA